MDEFISAVYKNEMLWNKKHKNYKNNTLKSYIWEQIANEFGISGEDAEKKIVSLRQKYCRERNIEKDSRSGAAASSRKAWEYFEALKFLDGQIAKRMSCSSLKKLDTIEEIDIVQTDVLGSPAESRTSCYLMADLETTQGSDIQYESDTDVLLKESEQHTELQRQTLWTPTPNKTTSQDSPAHRNKRQRRRTSDDFTELIAAMKAPVTIEQTTQPESKNERRDAFLAHLGQIMKNVPREQINNLEMEILQLVNKYRN